MTRVSVVIPVWNGEAFVARAIRSALEQTVEDIEVLVADNGSTDGTWAVLERLAKEDSRVRLLSAVGGRGPDVARNACLDVARGEWIAVLDADDAMRPERLERLLEHVEARGGKLVADNQRLVQPDGTFLRLAWDPAEFPAQLDTAGYVMANIFGRRAMALGYLKPLFHRSLIESTGIRYPSRPRVVEDYHFLYALVRQGATLHLIPDALYDYVQMPGSLSRTFGLDELRDIRTATLTHLQGAGTDQRLRAALGRRLRSVEAAITHCAFVDAVKKGRIHQALWLMVARPTVIPFVFRYGAESVYKRLKRLWASSSPRRHVGALAYFGQDSTEAGVIRRITAMQDAGHEVVGYCFRRQRSNADYVPNWENVALGVTRDRDYRHRILKMVQAAWLLLRRRRDLAGLSLFYARNIDMALLAWFAKIVSGSPAPLVYEILDVQRAFLGDGLQARLLRWAERRLLAHCEMLVSSSPGFVREYFLPTQGYRGKWYVLENKILAPQLQAGLGRRRGTGVSAEFARRRQGRRVIGWFGTLRCAESLRILSAIAEAMPEVLIYIRGYPASVEIPDFHEVVGRHDNMVFEGQFFSPDDLPDIYGAIDFAWCFDFLDAGANSDWLLPNRFYDAGYFGVPMLAAAGTQTGFSIEELGLGWTFTRPLDAALVDFLRRVTPEELAACRARIAAAPRSRFLEEDDTKRLLNLLLARPEVPVGAEPERADKDLARISGGM